MRIFKEELINRLVELVELSSEEISELLEIPPDPEMGDLAFPCFKLAKVRKKNPAEIASDLENSFEKDDYFAEIKAAGPYLNFLFNKEKLAELTINQVMNQGEDYGNSDEGRGRTVVIDFSSPNIAKPFGIGHLRSTVIGNALYNIYEKLGYNVIGINHLGDWGTQFGKLISAYLKWGDEEELNKDPIDYLYKLYTRYHQEEENSEELEEEGREWFRKLEAGDDEASRLWEKFRSLSLDEFKRIYDRLGVSFDSYRGEAYYNKYLDETIEKIVKSGIARESEGALVVDIDDEEDMPPCLLRKRDGATLYATRDICAAIKRYEEYKFEKCLYVVGDDQKLHFKQVFGVLDKMGYDFASSCEHIAFGLIRFKEGKMSTRMGNIIFLEDVLDKAKTLALDVIKEKNPDLENKEEVSEMVGVGAVIFGDLSNDRIKEVTFDWNKILDFNGETAPYLQYTHARICSILRKAKEDYNLESIKLLTGDYEQEVIKKIAGFEDILKRTRELNKPHILARYLLDLAKVYNRFYNKCPILNETADVKMARLALCDCVRQVLKNGLSLMGIKTPDAM
ncbi:arginine--tRNA ligase [Natranaerofaba carboxydovora]|uniref:arginine--tRNA ligase n=1 Tax=Natranaerofaba carboxydovora TaxID=2742683 RepID=UPI001F132897|nr:arginine--tRNA ligase [Natranaerofaba carboxydovora]UMZ73180.1 Arginine--tRNA ligase [Natranaerofaba carboxydovora]